MFDEARKQADRIESTQYPVLSTWRCIAILVAAWSFSSFTNAQEAGTPAGQFQATFREWNTLEAELTKRQREYEAAPVATRGELKKQYEQLVEQSSELLKKLGSAAEAAYAAAPNTDKNVTRTLIGILVFHYRQDQYEKALEIAKLLEQHNCPETAAFSIAGSAAYANDDFETAERYLLKADKADKLDPQGKDLLAALPAGKKAWAAEQAIREKEKTADDLPRVKLETNKGTIVIELFENEAPQAVGNFVNLVEKKFYDGLTFHRVLAGFMAQGGDPTGSGSGGPGYKIYCECQKPEARKHFRGTLSMAHAGKDTGGSQFFLTFGPATHLDGRHTAFGRVVEGFDVLAKIQRRDPQSPNPPTPDKIVKAEVIRKRDHAYEPVKVK
jgi:cyclophilin family peptidyl-prolyl cis-trans isomerase